MRIIASALLCFCSVIAVPLYGAEDSEYLVPPKFRPIGHLAPRLKFKMGGGSGTCTGFFIRPPQKRKCSAKKKRDSRPIFVTAAHCRYDKNFQALHSEFEFIERKLKLKLSGSQSNTCHDMLAHRMPQKRLKNFTTFPVSSTFPSIGDQLTTMGFPASVVGSEISDGVELSCMYEGVTQSEASQVWRADLLQHQMVCRFPFDPGSPNTFLGGISGGPVFNNKGEIVGVVSQQLLECPKHAPNTCHMARLLFSELTKTQFNCSGEFSPQRVTSRVKYGHFLSQSTDKILSVVADFDARGCLEKIYRSTKSPSFNGNPNIIDYSKIAPKL